MQTAAYLRQAIFTVADLDLEMRDRLLGPLYQRPRGPGRVESIIRSTLVGFGDDLAAPHAEYPQWIWSQSLKDINLDPETGLYVQTPNLKIEAQIADGISFEGISHAVFDVSIFTRFSNRATPEQRASDLFNDGSMANAVSQPPPIEARGLWVVGVMTGRHPDGGGGYQLGEGGGV